MKLDVNGMVAQQLGKYEPFGGVFGYCALKFLHVGQLFNNLSCQ